MGRLTGWIAGVVAGAAAIATVAAAMPADAPAGYSGLTQAPAQGADFSVLTYNVEGLPTPLAFGRASAAGKIAERLAQLRREGMQPHVVVLQEAFGSAQRAIGTKAGYRYVAFGPARDQAPIALAMTDEDRAFARKESFWKGETEGKWASSGLAILSDYPIVAVKRAAFPAWACAGYDCLANKGVLLAEVRVPGVDRPVAVIASHMNSKDASGVAKARWNYAFQRQTDAIGQFLRANLDGDTPYVFAGDTNIGKSAPRRQQFEAMFAGLPRASADPVVHTALSTCLGDGGACAMSALAEVRRSYGHGKDWQVYAGGAGLGMTPVAIQVPFGHDAAGKMLSDHIGYTALYRFAALAHVPAAAATRLASLR